MDAEKPALDKEIEKAIHWIQCRQDELEGELTECSSIGEVLRRAEQNRESLQKEKLALGQQLQTLSNQLKTARAELSEARQELARADSRAKTELSFLQKRSDDERRAALELGDSARKQVSELNLRVSELRQKIAELETQLVLRKTAEENLRHELEQAQSLSKQVQLARTAQNECLQELAILRDRLDESRRASNSDRAALQEELKQKMSEAERKVTALEQTLSQAHSALRESQQESLYFKHECRKREQALADLRRYALSMRENQGKREAAHRQNRKELLAQISKLEEENRKLRVSYPLEALIRSKESDIAKIRESATLFEQETALRTEATEALQLLERQRDYLVRALEATGEQAPTAEASHPPAGSTPASSRWN